ncbi:hypothetical protein D3C81_1781830 [compost metagenome]
MGWHVAGNQLEHRVAPVLPALAHQHPMLAALPLDGQAHGHAEVGQFGGEVLRVGHVHRPPAVQHLLEVQRQAEGLVDQAVRAGFHQQRQGLESGRVLAGERSGHGGSFSCRVQGLWITTARPIVSG